jgi:hypothetical protein
METVTPEARLAELQPFIEEAEAIRFALRLDYLVAEGFVDCLNPLEPCLVAASL